MYMQSCSLPIIMVLLVSLIVYRSQSGRREIRKNVLQQAKILIELGKSIKLANNKQLSTIQFCNHIDFYLETKTIQNQWFNSMYHQLVAAKILFTLVLPEEKIVYILNICSLLCNIKSVDKLPREIIFE